MMRLHGYWRSGAAWRVRIALHLKGLPYEQAPHDLRTGEQRDPSFLALNPQGLVPALEADGLVLTQSLAIIEWLDERFPASPLLPADPGARATVRAMAGLIACDIHPLNNLRVLKALETDFGADRAAREGWIAHWIGEGFAALEPMIARHGAGFAFGDVPGMADCFLVPQVGSARRFGVDMAPWPAIADAASHAARHPAFAAAAPESQPDADPA